MRKSGIKPGMVAFVAVDSPAICYLVSESLIRKGFSKVYAATQIPATKPAAPEERDEKIVPMQLSPLSHNEIKSVAKKCQDVNLLLNLVPAVPSRGRSHTVSRIGALGLNLAFVPVIAANGQGIIVNAIPQVSLLRLQLNAILGRELERRNVRLLYHEFDLQCLFFESSTMQCQGLATALLDKVL